MIVGSAAAADFYLTARDAPRWRITLELELRPRGRDDIADSRTGVGDQPMRQSHSGSDSGYFSPAENLPQLWKGEQRRMVNDIGRLLEYLDNRFRRIVGPQALSLCIPKHGKDMLQNLLRCIADAALLNLVDDPRHHGCRYPTDRELAQRRHNVAL